ncbi:MAG: hypothetical protein GC168_06715 [Candidatus Hydrogenedens sp.]|nr:hypothetical protein [Candidatus Hydrogenedens sp.]
MAQDENASPKGGSPLVRWIIMGGFVVLVPTILALLVFQFILRPMLSGEAAPPPEPEISDAIPEGAVPLEFAESQGAVLPDSPDLTAPILMYRVAMVCDSQLTSDLITAQMVYFTAMLDKLHRNRTRSELSDPQVQATILKRAEQEANTLLKRLSPKEDHKVLEVMYTKYGLIDL